MSEPQKVILKVELNCKKCNQRALRTAADIKGVTSVALDKDSNLVVIGNLDAVKLAQRLGKYGDAQILSIGPANPQQPPPPPQQPPPPPPPPPHPELIVLVPSCTCFSDENPNGCVIC